MNVKKCTKCEKIKSVAEFERRRRVCRECRAIQVVLYLRKHKKRLSGLFKQWLSKNREQRKRYCRQWYKKNKKAYLEYKKNKRVLIKKNKPWLIVLSNIKSRLANSTSGVGSISKHKKNKAYRFIKNYLTGKDVEYLWFRDKAYLMTRPSIHRKNSKGHYSKENCEFLELSLHNQYTQFKKKLNA